MSAAYQFLANDGVTPISSLNLGNVDSPDQSGNERFFVKNIGDTTAQGTVVDLVGVGLNDGIDYAQDAPNNISEPGPFGTTQIAAGDIAAGSAVAIWTRAVLPAGVTATGNPRRYNIQARGFTL